MKPTKFKLWVIKNQKIKFPDNWNKAKILKWCNEEAIRICPICNKLDVSYDHFNECNPKEQAVIRINREMAGW